MQNIEIQIPYTTAPKMNRNTGMVYNANPDPAILQEKQIQLSKYGADLWAQTETFKDKLPAICQLLKVEAVTDIKELAVQFEEDVAVMFDGKLEAICFCFPSSWIPAQRVGQTLAEIHMPVADSRHLVHVSQKLTRTMADVTQGSFRRYVWTVTNTAGLSNHPKEKNSTLAHSINDLYFRTETQTTLPLGDNITSLFFVKVNVVPLVDVWPVLGSKIRASINTMSDSIIEYKNLQNVKTILNKVLLL